MKNKTRLLAGALIGSTLFVGCSAGGTGPAGAKGETGAQGPTGSDGANTLVATSPVAAGATCAAGGIQMTVGLDSNRNGVLDDGEINATLTRTVCNGIAGAVGAKGDNGTSGDKGDKGDPGARGFATLATTSLVGPGIPCATGGTKLEFGVDVDGDSVLDATEIDDALTSYTCHGAKGDQGSKGDSGTNGERGHGVLARTTTELTSLACPGGGVKLEFGVDADNDAFFDPEELDPALTTYACNGAKGDQGLPGQNGLNTLVETSPVSPGTPCPAGGTMVTVGLDGNRNNALDVGEVNGSLTRYICAGEKGDKGPKGDSGGAGGIVWTDVLGRSVAVIPNGPTAYPGSTMEVIDPATGLVWLYDSGIGNAPLAPFNFNMGTYYYQTADCSSEAYVLMPPPRYPVTLPSGVNTGPMITRVSPATYVPWIGTLLGRRQFGSPFGCEEVSVNTSTPVQGVWMRLTNIVAAPEVPVPTLWFMPPLYPSIAQ